MSLVRNSAKAALLCSVMFSASAMAAPLPDTALQHDLAGATLMAPLSDTASMTIVLVPALRDPAGAATFASAVNTPGNPLYRQFLTPQQFADKFAMTSAQYASLVAWATRSGFGVNEISAGRTELSVTGSAARIGQMFGVSLNTYRAADGTLFHAPASPPRMPAEISSLVSGVIGLSNRTPPKPLVRRGRILNPNVAAPLTAGGTSVGGAYGPADLRTAYAVPAQPSPGASETLAVYESGGFTASDVATFIKQNKLPSVPVKPRLVNGFGGLVTQSDVELESVLDIDMQIGMNPAAKRVLVYEDGADSFGVSLLDSLTAMANDNTAQTISISYGFDEDSVGAQQIAAEGVLFQQLASQGQAVFVSSGDGGAYGNSSGLHVQDPGSQPFVTCVGGTSLFTGPNEGYRAEQAWNDLGSFGGGTGGGVSTIWALPSYQLQPGSTTVSVAQANGGSNTMRNVPDMAMVADPNTGVAVYSAVNGGWIQEGGTSASAPIAAGIFSLLDAERQFLGLGRAGFSNPTIYNSNSSSFLRDIEDGSNGNASAFGIAGFNAGFGYDNTTGLGSLVGQNLLVFQLMLSPASSGAPPAVTDVRATATATTIKVTWKPAAGATGYLLYGQQQGVALTISGPVVTGGDTATLTGLLPSTTYSFTVASVNKSGINQNQPTFQITTKKS